MGKTVVVACGLSVGVFAQVCYAADAVRVHHDEELFPLTEVRLTGGLLQAAVLTGKNRYNYQQQLVKAKKGKAKL